MTLNYRGETYDTELSRRGKQLFIEHLFRKLMQYDLYLGSRHVFYQPNKSREQNLLCLYHTQRVSGWKGMWDDVMGHGT
jgi:hypothetical protein